jgi:hypothetical protein
MATTRSKIKIITNLPLVITLEDAEGKESNSQFTGLEMRYSVLESGIPSTLYLPIDGANALRRSGAQAGEDVEILEIVARRLADLEHAPIVGCARTRSGRGGSANAARTSRRRWYK